MKGNPSGGENPGNSGGGKGGRNKNNDGPPAWKTKFKTAKITHNGKEWEWCKEHKREGIESRQDSGEDQEEKGS
eukprot:4660470-Ditylum_brightwellii.AAC.1